MRAFTVYRAATGEVMRTGACPDGMFGTEPGEGEAVLEGTADDTLHYVLDGEIVDRPTMPLVHPGGPTPADGTTTYLVQGIPPGAQATLNDLSGTVTGGELSLTFDEPGTYTLRLTCFPYRDAEVQIDAV